jgi:hypothetical protein
MITYRYRPYASRVFFEGSNGNTTTLAPSADFDSDGDIDGKDFLSWQRGYGTTAPNGTKQAGDANDDQNVDEQDIGMWQDQFGSTPVAAVVSDQAVSLLGYQGLSVR